MIVARTLPYSTNEKERHWKSQTSRVADAANERMIEKPFQ